MNPKSPQARSREDNPFEGMLITDADSLYDITSRSPCPRCLKSRMYFCYTCYVPVSQLEGRIPTCRLPIKVDIIKHKREIDGKSTASHAAVLAPYDVKIYVYPEVPDYSLDGKTYLLYPGAEARTISEIFQKVQNSSYPEKILAELPQGYNIGTLMKKIMSHDQLINQEIYHSKELPISRIVLIDSTWNQSRGIFSNERLQKLPTLVLQNRPSQFWRHQKGSPRWYLSTVEALHQVMLEMHLCAWGRSNLYKSPLVYHYPVHPNNDIHEHCTPYEGQYDNMLYFFKFMYEKLHNLYKHEDLLAYKRPML